jgi:hypothetical protein
MQGGDASAIIALWRTTAERSFTDERDRADLGSLAKTFATLAGCRPVWDEGLRGWNMKTSPFLDEIRAEARAEAARELVLRIGRQRFGKGPTRKQQKTLEAVTDLAQLFALAERIHQVGSWAELLDELV